MLLILLSYLAVISAQSLVVGYGARREYDRMINKYVQTQTNPEGGLVFNFEHELNGKYFTYFTVMAPETILVSLFLKVKFSNLIKHYIF